MSLPHRVESRYLPGKAGADPWSGVSKVEGTNNLAYCSPALLVAVKSFIIQVGEWKDEQKFNCRIGCLGVVNLSGFVVKRSSLELICFGQTTFMAFLPCLLFH
jgi:hypothetical protein